MFHLMFLTSNMVKLAHARHIAKRFPVEIVGFRQRTYSANYDEPRLESRTLLLEASYRNALRQCSKAGISTEHQFFFLEDTSVRIDALSGAGKDVPGLDVKYWMKETTFWELDNALKRAGNDRSAQVRSDVLLHIPETFRWSLSSSREYCVFTGIQDGFVTDREILFDQNTVFPWLDNRTFNRWFCPENEGRPLGSLNIDRADEVDFRRKSMEQLLVWLLENDVIHEPPPQQLAFSLDDHTNLILCGYPCAGKTTASQYLAKKYGYFHIEASDFMHLSYYHRHGYRRNVSVNSFAEEALIAIPHIVAEQIVEYILREDYKPVVISGFRASEEIRWLILELGYTGMRFDVAFVDVPQKVRFSRMQTRNRTDDKMSFDEFVQKDTRQGKMGLEFLKNYPNVSMWKNDSSLEAYFSYIDSAVATWQSSEIDVHRVIGRLKQVREVRLEDAILAALLSVWSDSETRPYFTTSEIAKLINDEVFINLGKKKHRENVHKYFNRDYYAYYEIGTKYNGRIRTYRLSNTGYCRGLRSLRALVAD